MNSLHRAYEPSRLVMRPWLLSIVLICVALSGCSSLVSSVTQSFAEDLSSAILDNEDIAMVRDGAPAYLILVDSLVARSPDDAYLLQQSATLNSAYAAAFVNDEARSKLLHAKARRQALDAVCLRLKDACGLDTRKYADFETWLERQKKQDIDVLYGLATAWTGWIQVNSDDFNAVADLARVKALLTHASTLDPDYENGSIYLYLGVFETLLPPALGGRPEVGRGHFENAIARSEGKNLLAKVMFADQYARLVFDRELHDSLLQDVVQADPRQPGLTLMNIVAQEQAQQLLETADDYF
ncbi:MAG: TRAP transporter TatT component family protein [Pseudomonadota bacterium]